MSAYSHKWFEKEDYANYESEHFHSFERKLDWILHDFNHINKSYLNLDYDTISGYVKDLEKDIAAARKIMEENPEMKSPKIEKFLEETLNEAKVTLHRCPRRNANTTWEDRYTEEESYQERKARWDYWRSLREEHYREEQQKEPWFNY